MFIVANHGGTIIGNVQPDGSVFAWQGHKVGYTTPDGSVFDTDGHKVGYTTPDGTIHDPDGTRIGICGEAGEFAMDIAHIHHRSERVIRWSTPEVRIGGKAGSVYDEELDTAPVSIALAGAAALLLLKDELGPPRMYP